MRPATWRETLTVEGRFKAEDLAAHVVAIGKMPNMAPTHVHVKEEAETVSLAYMGGPHGLLGESVVASAGVPHGLWVGGTEDGLMVVYWDHTFLAERLLEPKDVLQIDPSADLFYSNLDELEITGCFGKETPTLLVLEDAVRPVLIGDVIKKIQSRESRPKKIAILTALLVLVISGLTTTFWPRDNAVPQPVLEALVDPLASYRTALDKPSSTDVLQQMQQAYWYVDDLAGWQLDTMSYTPEGEILLGLSTPQPFQGYLHDWVAARPFDLITGADNNHIFLRWDAVIPSRAAPGSYAENSNQHLWMMDQVRDWGMNYMAISTVTNPAGFTSEHFTIMFSEHIVKPFEIFTWLLNHHPDSIVEGIELRHSNAQWQGQIALSLLMKTQEETL